MDSADRIEAMADALLAAAKEYYGQGFKTDRKYWLALATSALTADNARDEASFADLPFEVRIAGAEAITVDHMEKRANYDAACDCWDAMNQAIRSLKGAAK